VILTVYLNNTQQMLTEVPITPATRVADVVEYCKEAGEGDCHLAEVWNGHERALPQELLLLDLLQQWGARRPEVSFYLRHCPPWTQGRFPEKLTHTHTHEPSGCERSFSDGGKQTDSSEAEKLQRLKERVETQEAKLKKIRAMRGQVDYSKLINGNLSAEIDHMSTLFQEKQAELQSAVIRVDQLTQQLEDLRRGRVQLGSPLSGPAAVELRKLYQELQARNRHNLEQSSKLAQNKELLNKRNAQVTVMDQRICDLRERLHKKRAEVSPVLIQTREHRREMRGLVTSGLVVQLSRMNGAGPASPQKSPHSGGGVSGRVLPSGYGTYPSASHQAAGHHSTTSSLPRSAPGTLGWPRSTSSSSSSSSSQQIQQRISVPPASYQSSDSAPQPPQTERTDPPPAVAVRPYVPDHPSRPQSPRKGPPTMNSSSIYSMYLHQPQSKSYGSLSNRTAVKAVYGKPILPTSSSSPSPIPFLHGGGVKAAGEDVKDKGGETGDGQVLPPPIVENIPRPLSPTKLTPMAHAQMRYQSDTDLEVLRRRLSNAPRPLKKRSSITEPEGPQGPNIQKLLYQRFNTLAGGMEGGSGNPFYQPDCLLGDMDNIHSANGNMEPSEKPVGVPAVEAEESRRSSPPFVTLETNASPSPAPFAPPPLPKVKRTNLKKPSSERTGHGLRVKFNPLALLLDASLEGEFDLVQRIIYEVENPSMPNDEGITPLHNAVCAGHHHIVKFLLDFGVNVNAADSDGWTPLHCAASCNSVHLCKMLVESGAAIFATTISDVETAADKCEEMEEGYSQCSQFLYGVQEKLGVMNKGLVYALWDYTAQQNDELSFREGDTITVLRRHDDTETEWWWARLSDREGYVPRNLLGVRTSSCSRVVLI
uniref:Protein phosphatase 1, regulatory subunit 13Ba n=1 Tax=Nothobranchius furzeri TaxID=105023 RepID=A0A8C6PVY0_NOTFU